MKREQYDAVVVGGGFFGIALALEARRHKPHVLLVEAERSLMARSSYGNQARVHQGYHYPRSVLTAERSRVNFSLFTEAYAECVVSDFRQLYAIALHHSKVSATQFKRFCERIGAPIAKVPRDLAQLFDARNVEASFLVHEYAFDSHKLRDMCGRALIAAGIEVLHSTEVTDLACGRELSVTLTNAAKEDVHVAANWLFNCTYANLNVLLARAGLEQLPLKHEYAEIALIEPPPVLDKVGITLMDGPFFSCMPFPAAQAHSLTHVRYTPHENWLDTLDRPPQPSRLCDVAERDELSLFEHMVRDSARYVPVLADSKHRGSIWEVKTILPQSEHDDSRPILFRRNPAEPRVVSVLGAKIDNVIDVHEHVAELLSA